MLCRWFRRVRHWSGRRHPLSIRHFSGLLSVCAMPRVLAREVAAGNIWLEPTAPVTVTIDALQALPGVGPWTAQYIAMRALAWPDAFPHPDVAVLRAMKQRDAALALERVAAWRPWRAYAVLHLWKSLEAS